MTAEIIIKLEQFIDENDLQDDSDTPAFILARYLYECLCVFNTATKQRDIWQAHIGYSKAKKIKPNTGEQKC